MTHPFPPLVTNDPEALAEALAMQLGLAWDRLEHERQLVLSSVDLGRNDLVVAQLEEFQQAVAEFQRVVQEQVGTFVQRDLPALYASGAQAADPRAAFVWTQLDIDALTSLAGDTYGDFLRRSQEAGRTSARFARAVRAGARKTVPASAAGHMTSRQAAELFRKELETSYGITAATYADGTIHSMREYTRMAVLTKGAVARNYGMLNRLSEAKVKYVEVFDGDSCGWTRHDDPDRAAGSFRTLDAAFNFPIAHPNCQRTFGGRPDLKTEADALKAISSISEEARADQAAFDQARRGLPPAPRPLRPAEAQRARLASTRVARRQGATRRDLQQALANLVKGVPEADAMDTLMEHAGNAPGKYLDPNTLQRLAEATYEMAYAADGVQFGTKVTSVEHGVGPASRVRGDVLVGREKAGSFVTEFTRFNGEVRVEHQLIELDERFQGHGFGTAFTQWTDAYYRTHGVTSITLQASGEGTDIGGYVWARAGFGWATERDAEKIAVALDELALADPEIAVRAHSLALQLQTGPLDKRPTERDVAELGHDDPTAATWPGKELMKNLTWNGVRWLPR